MKVAIIAGGTGAAKLVEGFMKIEVPSNVNVIVNVGDDTELHGLYICPDFDMLAYTVAGIIDPVNKWGITGDTFQCLETLNQYDPASSWFALGDKDLATHIFRTGLLKAGYTLTAVAGKILDALHVEARLLPCTNDRLRTIIRSGADFLDFQHYFVKLHAEPIADEIIFDGCETARATPDVIATLQDADKIIIAPSNPYLSIDPILAVDDIKQILVQRAGDVAFVSPVVAGDAIKGPTVKIMRERGLDPSCVSVARHYQGIASDAFIDAQDEAYQSEVETLRYNVHVSDTIMDCIEKKEALARFLVSELQ
jgi:LPPG:FO 2-phospho-L-lactate transferase